MYMPLLFVYVHEQQIFPSKMKHNNHARLNGFRAKANSAPTKFVLGIQLNLQGWKLGIAVDVGGQRSAL